MWGLGEDSRSNRDSGAGHTHWLGKALTWVALAEHLNGSGPLGVPDLLVALLERVRLQAEWSATSLGAMTRPTPPHARAHLEPLPGQTATQEVHEHVA